MAATSAALKATTPSIAMLWACARFARGRCKTEEKRAEVTRSLKDGDFTAAAMICGCGVFIGMGRDDCRRGRAGADSTPAGLQTADDRVGNVGGIGLATQIRCQTVTSGQRLANSATNLFRFGL